jgi:ribonucleoside-diphosphate reductase alpha chain
MIVYNVDGEVIEKFVTRKRESGRLVGANVSVGVTDEFMSLVKANAANHAGPLNELARAGRIWSLIVESARNSAEPGVLFLDRYNGESNSWYYAEIEATNP